MIVGIGAAADVQKVISSITRVCGTVDVRCFTSEAIDSGGRFSVHVSDRPDEALVSALADGSIDAAVRGTLPANSTLKLLKDAMGVDRLERIALLETVDGKRFLLAPVGVDEGWTIEHKAALIADARRIAGKFGLNENVAVLSGGRLGDIGRHEMVDRSIAAGEELARITGADHTEILIEDAVADHGIIIAPDGIAGNLIFRTLALLGGGRAHGAPVVNIDRIFVDTSRASADYSNAILLAASLVD